MSEPLMTPRMGDEPCSWPVSDCELGGMWRDRLLGLTAERDAQADKVAVLSAAESFLLAENDALRFECKNMARLLGLWGPAMRAAVRYVGGNPSAAYELFTIIRALPDDERARLVQEG